MKMINAAFAINRKMYNFCFNILFLGIGMFFLVLVRLAITLNHLSVFIFYFN